MKGKLSQIIEESLKKAISVRELQLDKFPFSVIIEKPKDKVHGDLSVSIAFSLAEKCKKSPLEVASIIYKHLKPETGFIEKVEIAGGGFLNFFISKTYLCKSMIEITRKGNKFGHSNTGGGKRIQVEFASVGPTGPVHIGHSRGAVIGDVLANILEEVGYRVTREYYINDVGTQIEILGKSLMARYEEILGKKPEVLEGGYEGQYISNLAIKLKEKYGEGCLSKDVSFFSCFAVNEILVGIKKDFEDFGVRFDKWVNESELYHRGEVKNTIELLKKKGWTTLENGALWFADDVLVRSSGVPTYFASDIAYHLGKYKRKFYCIIDIWGQDHHGHVSRLGNALKVIGCDVNKLEVILYQLVSLSRRGEPVKMSTRKGEFITLREVMDEVGRDSIRFFFLMRKSSSHLNFDLELAKAQSLENPIYYVQYAHARIFSIFREAKKQFKIKNSPTINDWRELEILNEEVEIDIMKKLAFFPDEIAKIALAREPQGLTVYLQELAALFHRFYTEHRVISNNLNLTHARFVLINSVQIVLAKGLRLMGIEPRKRM
ncbi:arginine--tRNA ligase [Candidatus Desantisbacteria bacterium CG1_02_38_46]|uniref:Arginine--tRNA ligase n=3 Tax=unclassified Candidatus Desantisiibacteriota TaxID=3106372 RepID=A0A2H9PAP2_9BACT|nr:MAG: arginine--tRNA ligase [Candidatus Desantisbacteria bacterium CG1_02_38_46]PIU50888.1 MAG: arginine--tRNA ligase [Candidatus Desantisbacteria bacterium CG07_land_8_20_14_0_80_39_15]PIZ15626.1 MAG: arginine--tRNA ligase [Candidatus Desantisbacteria bacterium CG_4_10_14_0_8_um_filter_39_17]